MLKNLLRSLRPRRAARLNEDGLALWHGGDLVGAERAFRAAIDAAPDFAPAFGNLGMVVWDQRRLDEGLALLTRAVELDPRHLNARLNLGNVLAMAGRREESVAHFREVLRSDPGHAEARANLLRPLMDLCEWDAVDAEVRLLAERWAREGAGAWLDSVTPYMSLLMPVAPAFRLAVARHHAGRIVARAGPPVRVAPRARGKRLRIGYASADFHDHAVAHLTVGLFERHDRARFELHGYSFGHDDGSDYRRRIAAACDGFADLRTAPFRTAAERIAADGLDVLVDLMGHTGGSRPEVFALRPAPLQATWLGYPGTTGGGYMDYLIADRIVLPECDFDSCSEQVIWLPDCYMPTDDTQPIAARVPSRAECGLPERGVVFCVFNQTAKIDAAIFAIWMRVLAAVTDSVLWLSGASPGARRNLERGGGAGGRRTRAARVRVPRRFEGGAPGAASRGRPVPRHASLQRAHDGVRCAVGGAAGVDVPRTRVPRARGDQPAACGRAARAQRRDARGLRARGGRSRARARPARRAESAPRPQPARDAALRNHAVRALARARVRSDAGAARARRAAGPDHHHLILDGNRARCAGRIVRLARRRERIRG